MKEILILLPIIIGFLISRLYDKKGFNYIKSNLQPPGYVFSIVWSILYILIGVSYYIGLNKQATKYYIIPVLGLIFNYLYTPLFFGYKQILYSMIIVILTLLFTILTIIQFYYSNVNKYAIYLLIPYLIWLIFALILSVDIYIKNKKFNY